MMMIFFNFVILAGNGSLFIPNILILHIDGCFANLKILLACL